MFLVLRLKPRHAPTWRRLSAFAASAILHLALIAVMMTRWFVKTPTNPPATLAPKYSVLFVHLQTPRDYQDSASTSTNLSGGASHTQKPGTAAAGKSEPAALTEPSIAPDRRRLQLPPNTRVQPVTQTLVQMDVPPDIVLKQEIPLPNILLWTQTKLPPPIRKQFVAPPVKKVPAAARSLPDAPVIVPPNREIDMATLNLAATIVNDAPHLIQPAAIAPPVSTPGPEPAKEIPQIGLANSNPPSAANVISAPNTPLRSSTMAILPPANQMAPSDRGNAGSSSGDGTTSPQQGSGALTLGPGSAAAGESRAGGKGNAGTAPGLSPAGNNSAPGNAPGSSGAAGETALAANGRGVAPSSINHSGDHPGDRPGSHPGDSTEGKGAAGGRSADGSAGSPVPSSAGLTRITQPKDGKFAVVMLGSPDSARYSESAGALSGKVVYTVYLRVGLRKNWILQYSLPNTAAKSVTGKGSATPLQAPWPLLMMRLDGLSAADSDYIMVRGMLKSDGRFEQLAMVFPEELEKKDLLLNSLKLWEFRPASRDGEPVAVEVILIIPRETD